MTQPLRAITLARLNDTVLGAFAHAQPSETLDHLVRYLGTWSGSDKLFMVIQYAVKLIVPLLQLRARLQHRAGFRKTPNSHNAEAYEKLGNLISDSRTLWRIWGLFPIFQWLISLERSPPATRNLLTIERLQGWSMLAYYPLEHLWYLLSHGLISSTVTSPLSLFSSKIKKIKLDADTMGMWSCRFWALYVVLHFAHLVEDRKILQQRQRTMKKARGTGLTTTEKQELRQRWDAFWSEVVINVGYLPLTIHWSLEQGLFENEAWLGVFGLIAAVASFRTGWKATALPPPPPTVPVAKEEPEAAGYDVSTNQSPAAGSKASNVVHGKADLMKCITCEQPSKCRVNQDPTSKISDLHWRLRLQHGILLRKFFGMSISMPGSAQLSLRFLSSIRLRYLETSIQTVA